MVRLLFNTPLAGVADAVSFIHGDNGRQSLSITAANQASEQLALLLGGDQ